MEGSDSSPISEFKIVSYKNFDVRFSLVRYLEGYLTVIVCAKWFQRSCVNHTVNCHCKKLGPEYA
jgi:hypothetical protein